MHQQASVMQTKKEILQVTCDSYLASHQCWQRFCLSENYIGSKG